MSSLADWLAHLEALHPRGQAGIVLGLSRVQTVKARLLQQPFCPLITVGGTNGKGSTVAMLESILKAAGYRVGAYTSPHLLVYNERVRLNGVPVSDADLCAAFARVEAARQAPEAVPLTYFEMGTLAAWEVFAAAQVEVMLLEVGLGGRLDAVNAYDPDVAIVTGVALDHIDWLGETREAIGFEKAGIFRAARPAFCADADPPQTLINHAGAIGANLFLLGRDFGFLRDSGERLQWRWWQRVNGGLQRRNFAYPGLRGERQLANASVVVAALETLSDRLPVSMQAMRDGLIRTELAGRFQVLPGRPAVVLDVAHNPQAVAVLADHLGSMGFYSRTLAVVGMLADKDAAGALQALKGRVDLWYVAGLDGPRAAPAEKLAEIIRQQQLGGEVQIFADVGAAFRAARGGADESDRIVAFGSFLTVAGVLKALQYRS